MKNSKEEDSMKRTFFFKNLVDKKIVRKLALAVMAAVLCAYCSESGVLTASAASRSVTAVRKYNVLSRNTKTGKELKTVPAVKTGKNTVKVNAIGKNTKKYKGYDVPYWNGIVGDAQYKYYSFVKFTAPQTGYYHFNFTNLKMSDKGKMYCIMPEIWKTKKEYILMLAKTIRYAYLMILRS